MHIYDIYLLLIIDTIVNVDSRQTALTKVVIVPGFIVNCFKVVF